MPSISALRLVDRVLLPAVVLVATKLLGIFLASLFFGLVWKFDWNTTSNNFLFIRFVSQNDLSTAVNFSDTLVILACGIGFSWTLFQARHLNINRSHPNIISRIYKFGKEIFITDEKRFAHQAGGWLTLSWLVLFLTLVNVFQGLTGTFVLGISLAVTLGLTFVFYDLVAKN